MREEGTKITIRNVPDTLKQAMNLRANKQRRSREKMLLDILQSEFSFEEMAIRKALGESESKE